MEKTIRVCDACGAQLDAEDAPPSHLVLIVGLTGDSGLAVRAADGGWRVRKPIRPTRGNPYHFCSADCLQRFLQLV